MRVLVAIAVLVVTPCASAVGAELTDGQAKVNVGTEPQTAEPPPAQGWGSQPMGVWHRSSKTNMWMHTVSPTHILCSLQFTLCHSSLMYGLLTRAHYGYT